VWRAFLPRMSKNCINQKRDNGVKTGIICVGMENAWTIREKEG